MTHSSRQGIDRYWAAEMGLASAFPEGASAVQCTAQERYPGVQLFRRGELLVAAAPPHLTAHVASGIRDLPVDRIFSIDFVERLLAPRVERTLGPAHVHYADGSTLQVLSSSANRLLTPDDAPHAREFLGALSTAEFEESGLDIEESPAFGAFDDGILCALASYQVWEPNIAHIGVATHPAHRRRGHGRRVVSALAAHALSRNLILQYRALASNGNSLKLAHSLGFQRYCSTIYARLSTI